MHNGTILVCFSDDRKLNNPARLQIFRTPYKQPSYLSDICEAAKKINGPKAQKDVLVLEQINTYRRERATYLQNSIPIYVAVWL